ncbi:unnamed protein product, partial [Ectocarpus fasciculatus]
HFAVVGGSPLRGDRYFAGPPDTLAFQAAVIAESAVYPTLDRGVAASGDCLRKVAVPPVVVPTITGPPGSSASRRGGGGGQGSSGSFLPTLGRFPAGGAAEKTEGKDRGGGEGEEDDARHDAATALLLSPSWLGAFTVSAYDETVTVPFEVAAIVDGGNEAGGVGGVRRGAGGTGEGLVGRALGVNGTADVELLTSDYGGWWRRRQQQQQQQHRRQPEDQGRRWRRRRRRGLTEGAAGFGQREGRTAGDQSGAAGGGGEKQEETHQGGEEDRRLDNNGDRCEVTVCAAAARIVFGIGEQEDDGDVEVPQEDYSSGGGQQRVCRSVVVGGQEAAVSGTLDLPDRPQTGRWYLTARAACAAAPGTARHKQRSLRRSLEGVDVLTTAASQDEGGPGAGGGVPRARAAAASPPAAVGGKEEEKNIYSGTGWGLEVLSLQRDWAHVEWSADFLVPDVGGGGGGGGDAGQRGEDGEGGGGREACSFAAGGEDEDAFVFRAAAFTEACPRGAVGVSGVDLRPVSAAEAGFGEGGAAAIEPHRFSCVGAELPMLMRRDGAARIHEGQPRALSNFVRDEGGAAAAAVAAGLAKSGSKEEKGGAADAQEAPRWLWRGPGPPSLWYALEMSGREVGASMEVRLSVNSSAPLTTAAAAASAASLSAHGGAGSPSAWHMGPKFMSPSGGGGGDARGEGGVGAPVVRSVPVEDASSMNLSVAMRVGALPVVDPNGTAREGTVILWTADALSEPGEASDRPPPPPSDDSSDATAADFPWWSTTFTWNLTHPPPLHPAAVGGGAGLGRGTSATTLFVVVSGETKAEASRRAQRYGGVGSTGGRDGKTRRRRTAEREVEEGDGGDGDEAVVSLWTLGVAPEVTFRYCDEDVCPVGRGECRAARGGSGDDYVTVSKCYCFYGYGGEACGQRVVSYVSLLWQFCLLVLSNLAVVPAVRVALRLGLATGAAPAVVLGLNGAASAFYHMCDLELTCAGGMLSFHSLQALDFFFSFFSVAALVLHLCPMPWDEPLRRWQRPPPRRLRPPT